MRTKLLLGMVLLASVGAAFADLVDYYVGYDAVWELGVSGLKSSYYADTKVNKAVTGPSTGSTLASLGPDRVSYPGGVGTVPSPGGAVGPNFDQGVLGLLNEGSTLTFRLATALDPQTGYYYSGWHAWYSQGDLFLDVADDTGVRHFALLNYWPRDPNGNPLALNGGHFTSARTFHLSGATGLEGHLVRLVSNSDVTITGGTGAYTPSNAPTGLDLRAYANGGTDLGYADLSLDVTTWAGRTWYVQTWTVARDLLSEAPEFQLGAHSAASCGNDQIGYTWAVPEPAALAMSVLGLLLTTRRA